MLRIFGLLLLLSASLFSRAQSRLDLPPHQLHADSLAFDLQVLCSPKMAGRGTGQAGFAYAARYVSERLAAWGWRSFGNQPDGPDVERFYSQVPYKREHLLGAELKLRNHKLRYRKDYFLVTNVASGSIKADSVVFLGYGRENAKGAIVFDTNGVRGKWVVALAGSLTPTGEVQASYWREAYRQLANAGVAGMLLCEPQYDKESVSMLERLEEERISLRLTTESPAAGRGMATVVLSPKAFDKVLRQMRLHPQKIALEAKKAGFANKKLYLPLELLVERKVEDFEAPNVVAYLPGESLSNEWLIVSAHLDHLGTHHGKVFQGADDNGSGSAALLSLARQLSLWESDGMKPKRNIVLVWFSGEENGLLGSRYFADHLPMPTEEVIANVNVDMIGRYDDKHTDMTSKYIYVIGADRISQDLHDWHEAVNNQCCRLELDYTFNALDDPNRYYFRSDHYNFAKKGIPSMFYFSGVHADYHKEGDTIDKINFNRMAYITELILYNCWNLANNSERPKPKE